VLLGGILVNNVSWAWIFFINVPVGVAVIIAAPRLLIESRVEMETRSFDFAGEAKSQPGRMP
jgi:MFS family permease